MRSTRTSYASTTTQRNHSPASLLEATCIERTHRPYAVSTYPNVTGILDLLARRLADRHTYERQFSIEQVHATYILHAHMAQPRSASHRDNAQSSPWITITITSTSPHVLQIGPAGWINCHRSTRCRRLHRTRGHINRVHLTHMMCHSWSCQLPGLVSNMKIAVCSLRCECDWMHARRVSM